MPSHNDFNIVDKANNDQSFNIPIIQILIALPKTRTYSVIFLMSFSLELFAESDGKFIKCLYRLSVL
jgi:hypothetical protein